MLFDWTVRNIQLEADSDKRMPMFPWETLLFGHGTAAERAWVFILTAPPVGHRCRDARTGGIARRRDGQRCGTRHQESEERSACVCRAVGRPAPWCVGVLIEGKVYLFDPTLGLPIPAAGGIGREESGELSLRPATLAQIASDEKLLRQLDADPRHPYPVKMSDLKHVVVMLEASPTYLAKRMKLLESRLAGANRIVLSTAPTAEAERWKASGHVARVRLWRRPFETIARRSHLGSDEVRLRLMAIVPFYVMPSAPLHRARLLYLKGKLTGEDGATRYFQLARPSNEQVLASSAHEIVKGLYLAGKHDASYWLGLVAYQLGKYPAAADYFLNRTLEAVARSPWATGATYNLGRTFEISGDTPRAIALYTHNPSSPDELGELLRAKWLKETMPK